MKEIQQEITPITNEDLFIILNHPNAHFDYPIHCHPEYEINLVMNTRGSRIVGDSTEDFGPLDLVMTGPYRQQTPVSSHPATVARLPAGAFVHRSRTVERPGPDS